VVESLPALPEGFLWDGHTHRDSRVVHAVDSTDKSYYRDSLCGRSCYPGLSCEVRGACKDCKRQLGKLDEYTSPSAGSA
jgi:hypothetical protein